ncbi:MAG: glycoside hydrolase 100 family protein [Chromatiales bacterium]|nr:glycoside hydrolase 100 family protein [Chromatiales bacterium]
MNEKVEKALELLQASVMRYRGQPVGTVAAMDPNGAVAENYHDCFVRDFIPSALVFLAYGEFDIVRNFLKVVPDLRKQHNAMLGHEVEPAVLPASFRVLTEAGGDERIQADFGDQAIGRVAPVDAMMWWAILLGTYVRVSGDRSIAELPQVQQTLRGVLELSLKEGYEVFPTLLVPDGSFMIDRRMAVYGHPLEIQALFYGMLHTAVDLLDCVEDCSSLVELATQRMHMLRSYVRMFYWLDPQRLNEIHRYKTEEFGTGSVNMLNIYPESIPSWVVDWLPRKAGYLVGNLGPGRMDFRYFALGNLLAALFGITTSAQTRSLMRLYAQRWDDLVGEVPAKIVYPAVTGKEWSLVTGSDPKNVAWSYHNGGNWPVLLWPLVAVALKAGSDEIAHRVFDQAEQALPRDQWPEYYDGRRGNLLGRRAHLNQIWSVAAWLFAHRLLEDGVGLDFFAFRD